MKPSMLRAITFHCTVRLAGIAVLLGMALSAQADVTIPSDAEKTLPPVNRVQGQERIIEVPAQSVTRIDVHPDGSEVTIRVAGDGRLFPQATMLDDSRLIVDLPAVASAVRNPVMRTSHQLLKKIRVGHHADKVRLVFDVLESPSYSVTQMGHDV